MTWAISFKQKIEILHLKNGLLHHLWYSIFLIFCLDEFAQINKIYLPLNPRVPDDEKFMDKAFKSIKYSQFKKVLILAIFLQFFNIFPKV